jgi:PST family polysaccharide transporter
LFIILARLLTPSAYGIVAMVTALTVFISIFKELGLSGATIQSKSITHDQISVLFWINVGLGTLITLVIAAAAPFIAWFYGKPELVLVTVGISLTSVISSLGTQHGALLSRQMHFTALAVIHILALLAGLFAAVGVAISGGTYWALVTNQIVSALLGSIGLWIASDFRPGWPRRGTGARKLIRFGVNIVGFDFFNHIKGSMDNILIGRVWGAESLGLYRQACNLLILPLKNIRYPLNRVAFPAMSRLQNDAEHYKSYFSKYCSLLAFISMPIVAFLYLCAENIIRLLLGDRWLGTVELFQILAIAGFIQTAASLRTTVMMSSGNGHKLPIWGICESIAAVAGYICGLPWGPKGVAISYSIVSYLILHPSLLYAFRGTPIRTLDFYRAIALPFGASLTMCIAFSIAINNLPPISEIYHLVIALPFCTLTYLAVFCIFPGGRQKLKDYREYTTIIFRRSK